MMLSKNTLLTIATKAIILLANFALVVFSTQIWGSEGRGEIALVFANISIITIFSNIFCGGTISYHSPAMNRDALLTISLFGAILTSLAGGVFFSVLFGYRYFLIIFLISLLLSLLSAISSYWLGKNNIKNYNLISLLTPVFVVFVLALMFFGFHQSALNVYFRAFYLGTSIVLILGIAGLILEKPFKVSEIPFTTIKSILSYGTNNEFNYLIQFLNYRLSYYFIAIMAGLAELGIFSVVISISEAVWIISRSMSAIHFSNVINSDDQQKSRRETIALARQSFIISMLVLSIVVLIPRSLYQLIFGNEFGDVKKFIIILLPGIIAIAVSNLFGHYFSGSGNLKILRNKSIIGLITTIAFLPLMLYKYQLTGVCISLNISYLLSSFYLWFRFRKEGQMIYEENNNS